MSDVATAADELILSAAAGLTDAELAELFTRAGSQLQDRWAQTACIVLARRLAALTVPRRVEAERDGWREIAHHLLRIAFGDDEHAAFELPPLELISDLRRDREDAARFVPALEQFWADLTRKHEQRRRSHELSEVVAASAQDGGTFYAAGAIERAAIELAGTRDFGSPARRRRKRSKAERRMARQRR